MNKLLTCIVSLIIIILSVCFVIFPDISFSENENRYFQEYPKFSLEQLLDGQYMSKINK